MKIAKDYGFLSENDGISNAKALQAAVSGGGEIYVSIPGIYRLADQIVLGDNTKLTFCEGSYIKRERGCGESGYVFINEGAYTKSYNKNITVAGLNLICNGVTSDGYYEASKKVILGLKGHLSFFYVDNLTIMDFKCLDLPAKDFCIQICTFRNAYVENVHIEGMKDAVHFGRGSNFVVKHGCFKTFDDPIALNAHDYVTSNPELGWIENGLIEDCYDLNDDATTGYFCRILAGSWCAWYEGMELQRSDTVVSDGRLYRVSMPPDGRVYKSYSKPTHKLGDKEYDGFVWSVVQDGELYNCGCRNITFKDIYLRKNRPVAFSIHFDKDAYSRSYYPMSVAPVQEDISFDNVIVEADNIPFLLSSRTPVCNLSFTNCRLKNNKILFVNNGDLDYPIIDLDLKSIDFSCDIEHFISCQNGVKCNANLSKPSFNSNSITFGNNVEVDLANN